MTEDNRTTRPTPDAAVNHPAEGAKAARPAGPLDDIPDNAETIAFAAGPLSDEAAALEEEVLASLARAEEDGGRPVLASQEMLAHVADLPVEDLEEAGQEDAADEPAKEAPEESDDARYDTDDGGEPADEDGACDDDEPLTEEPDDLEEVTLPKPKTSRPPVSRLLFFLILFSSLAVAVCGTALKVTACKKAGILQDKFAVAIPFILYDDKSLRDELRQAYAPETEAPTQTEAPTTEAPTAAPTETATESETPTEAPVPAGSWTLAPVDEAYWTDVLFIGDSRTEGLKLYAPLSGAIYYCASSLGPYEIMEDTSKIPVKVNGQTSEMNLTEILQAREYKAVYVMLGINDIGHSMDGLDMMFRRLIDSIHQYQPGVPIVLQANLRVTDRMVNVDEYFTAERFTAFEGVLQNLAAEDDSIFYIDVNPLFCNEEGYLKDEYTKDGSHPYAAHYAEWKEFLMQNGVVQK